MFRFILTTVLLAACICMNAATPEGRLFRFERSTNRNYICYDVREEKGLLDMKEPIHVYWIRAEEDGSQKELSFVQRKLAFGYKVISRGKNEVNIHLTAYNKLVIRICNRGGKWVALTTINGKEALLTKLFAQMKSPNSLHVVHVDVYGRDSVTGAAVKERIMNE